MTSKLRSDTARANGAKSRGPKSAATREISSRNSLRHGLTSRHILVLQCEKPEEFQQLVDYYHDAYQPVGPVQHDLVREMIAAAWRLDRIRSVETVLLDAEISRRRAEVDREFVEPDAHVHIALSFRALADDSSSLALISRYESRYTRQHDRARRALQELQSAPTRKLPPAPAAEAPSPEPGLPPAPPAEPEIKDCRTNPGQPSGQPEKPCAHRLPGIQQRALFRAARVSKLNQPFRAARVRFRAARVSKRSKRMLRTGAAWGGSVRRETVYW
jgi:hypothetical protein